jgi:PAS domain S-box-containing protein
MFWSDETFRIFGYDRATKPAVEAFLERVHPEDKARVQEQIVRATREGKACDLEYRLLLPDDSVKHVHVVADASKDESGGFDVVGAVMDVSAAKEAGERIRKDERELATTIETIPALVLSFLADGTVDFVSHRWLEYVGLSREALFPTRGPLSPALGGEWKLTNHPDDLDRALSKWQASLATGEPLELETRYRRADGHYRWFLVRAVPLRDEIGTIVKWYATFSDIDDRKRAEDAIDAARSELARVARATTMSALTASIAHEVNQPLSGIITNAGTCLRMLDASPPDINGARDIAKRTMRDGNRAADVIARLRNMFSKREFTLEPMDLNEVTREVMALLSNDLQRNRAVLQVELADDLPLVNGDRIQLQQVILNLVRNASDAMIDVHDRPRQLLITTDREDGRVRLRVRDAGVGLSPKNIDSLFDPFYTTKSGGMGIGLFVSRSIIERHHGNLWAEPNQGLPGATFSFSIPHGEESPISTANTSQRS